MKLAKLFRGLSSLCFLLVWIPFAVVMIKGPLRLMFGNIEEPQAIESLMTSPWMYALGALFAGIFIFMIGSSIVGFLSNQQILANGQDAEAKILAITDTGTTINDDPVIEFSLQVQPSNYPEFTANAQKTVSIIQLPSFQPGKIVTVKFVPGSEQVAITGSKI